MKSTKAMEIEGGVGCMVQVTTQQRNEDGSYSVAEAVTFVPHVRLEETFDMNEIVKWINQGRQYEPLDTMPLPDYFNANKCHAWHNGTDIYINTLEGIMTASCGDWIIRGIKFEFYPCKPDIFAATYDLVE